MTETIIGKVMMTFRGEYDADTSYTYLDEVTYDGSTYLCRVDVTGILPTDTDHWALLAKAGRDGKNGADGKDGLPGRDGKDGAPGKDGEQGPQGIPGEQGEPGVPGTNGKDGIDGKDGQPGRDGTDGKSAYQIWLDNGHIGTEADFLNSLKGAKGDPGKDGHSVWQNTTHYGPNGKQYWFVDLINASASNPPKVNDIMINADGNMAIITKVNITNNTGQHGGTFDYSPWVGNIKGPAGPQGEPGVPGANGKDGTDGKSAYQIWLDNGHSGTETDFLNSLKGKDGTDVDLSGYATTESVQKAQSTADNAYKYSQNEANLINKRIDNIKVPTESDFNQVKTITSGTLADLASAQGSYHYEIDFVPIDGPASNWGLLDVVVGEHYAKQVFTNTGATGDNLGNVYIRTRGYGSTSWSEWREITLWQ